MHRRMACTCVLPIFLLMWPAAGMAQPRARVARSAPGPLTAFDVVAPEATSMGLRTGRA